MGCVSGCLHFSGPSTEALSCGPKTGNFPLYDFVSRKSDIHPKNTTPLSVAMVSPAPVDPSFITHILSNSVAIRLDRRLHLFVRAESTISVRPAVTQGDYAMAKKTVTNLSVRFPMMTYPLGGDL
jgi:hypothetical protein